MVNLARSHPVRGAWIEIFSIEEIKQLKKVASRKGCVDWNLQDISHWPWQRRSHPVRGAWIEIALEGLEVVNPKSSHPVRGAWIEIAPSAINEITYMGRIP